MSLSPRLLALATAVPPHALGQEEVVERVKRLFGRSVELDRLLPVFVNSDITRRYSTVPIEWYGPARSGRQPGAAPSGGAPRGTRSARRGRARA